MTAQAAPVRWHSIGSFEGPDRTYEVGVLGAMSYLLSPDGKQLTAGFHEFLNPFPDLEIDDKRYFIGNHGAISHILVLAPDGAISDLMETVTAEGDLERDRPLKGFHEIDYDSVAGVFVGTFGSDAWYVDPRKRVIQSASRRYEAEKMQGGRPFPIGLLLLVGVIIAALYFGSVR